MIYDLVFHYVTLLFTLVTTSAISISAYVFGYTFLGQGDITEAAQ